MVLLGSNEPAMFNFDWVNIFMSVAFEQRNQMKQSNKSGRSAGYVTGVCLSEAAKVHKGIISSYT